MKSTKISLIPLKAEDREQFILDNQWAFKYGAMLEFGERDSHIDDNREIISRTTETENGIKYDVVEYDNGNKDYFIGKTIIKTTAEDNSVMYYDSVSPIAPSSLFTPPADYKKTTVTDDKVSDMVEDIDPNAVAQPQSDENE